MWLTILDYRQGETKAVEVKDTVEDTDVYVHDLVGHSDFHYMTNESLVIQIDELGSLNMQIITKLKQ